MHLKSILASLALCATLVLPAGASASGDPVKGKPNNGEYYIQSGYIYGPKMSGKFYILNRYIYGPKNAGVYYVQVGYDPKKSGPYYIYGPKGGGKFYILNNYIYGPAGDLPWMEDEAGGH